MLGSLAKCDQRGYSMLTCTRGPGSAQRQADALRREHVEVQQDAMDSYSVDLSRYGWFPDELPNELSDGPSER